MRRLFLASLLLTAAGGATPADAACVATGGSSLCVNPPGACGPNSTIVVTVVGPGSGTATCGEGEATCWSFRGEPCTASDDAGGISGVLGCSATGGAVAICTVVVAST